MQCDGVDAWFIGVSPYTYENNDGVTKATCMCAYTCTELRTNTPLSELPTPTYMDCENAV